MLLSLKSDQLMNGMVLCQDIMTNEGVILMRSGGVLGDTEINSIIKSFKGNEILLDEPRLDSTVTLSKDIITRGVVSSIYNINDLETMYVMMSLLKESIGGYFSKLYPQLIDLRKADPVTFDHSLHVGWYSLFLGQAFGLSETDMRNLLQSSVLHDIGKTYIPNPLLTKKERLTVEEFDIIKKHSEYGESWSKEFASEEVCEMIRHHHEYPNGKGYPDGLKDSEIKDISHIITVADIFDALVSKRAYRDGLSPFVAYTILQKELDQGKLRKNHVLVFREILNCVIGYEVLIDKRELGILVNVLSTEKAMVSVKGNLKEVNLDKLSLSNLEWGEVNVC